MQQKNGPPPSYTNPFRTREEVLEFERRYLKADRNSQYPDGVACAAGAAIREGHNLPGNLQTIFRWKLRSFLKFLDWVKAWPDGISAGKIGDTIRVALAADLEHPATVVKALAELDKLPRVGIPVASAVLTWLYPKRFTVIDQQAYRALSVKFNAPRAAEYLHYLQFCQSQAAHLGVRLRS